MRIVSKIITALALAVALPSAASAAQLNCLNFIDEKTVLVANNTTTSSTSAVDIAGATLTQGFNNNSCVVVELTGQFKAPRGARVSLLITGLMTAPTVFPPTQDIVTAGTGFDTRTLTFVMPKVQCSCTIQVRVQSLTSGQSITGGRGTLRVLYNNDV